MTLIIATVLFFGVHTFLQLPVIMKGRWSAVYVITTSIVATLGVYLNQIWISCIVFALHGYLEGLAERARFKRLAYSIGAGLGAFAVMLLLGVIAVTIAH